MLAAWLSFSSDPKDRIDLLLKLAGGLWALILFTLKVKADRDKARADHAAWVTRLYEKFFERSELKKVREEIDCGTREAIAAIVQKCDPEFTDYLNFFEYVAYLNANGQLTDSEVEGLFGYYFNCLGQNPDIMGYIENTATHGYEQLAKLLHDRKR